MLKVEAAAANDNPENESDEVENMEIENDGADSMTVDQALEFFSSL